MDQTPTKRGTVLAVALAGLGILAGYEIVRPISSSLYIAEFGAARLPYVLTAVPLAAALGTFLYSALLRRLGPRRTLSCSLFACAAIGLAFYWLTARRIPGASLFFYLFGQVYIVLLLAQLWGFVNSVLRLEEAKKYNGLILGIASLGSVGGGLLTGRLAERVGSEAMILGAALLTAASAFAARWAYRRAGEPAAEAAAPFDPFAGEVFRRERRLLWLAAAIALAQVVGTLLDVAFHRAVEAAIPGKDPRSSFLGYYWSAVNGGALLLQLAGCPLLLPRARLRFLYAAVPLLHLVAAAAAAFSPTLGLCGVAFWLFKALDYSVYNAIKEMFYIPFSFAARYRAKAVIDAVIYRGAKGLTSAVLSAATAAGAALPLAWLPALGAAFSAAWAACATGLVRGGEKEENPILQKLLG